MMYIFDHRERVFLFERGSAFACEMTGEAQRHQTSGFSCKESDCEYPELNARIRVVANGLRDGKNHLFFAHFTCQDKVLWQGLLRDLDQQSDLISPIRMLVFHPDDDKSAQRNEEWDLVDDL